MTDCAFRTFDTSFNLVEASSPTCTYNSSDNGYETISYTISSSQSSLSLISFETGTLVNPSSDRVIDSFIVAVGSTNITQSGSVDYDPADFASASIAQEVTTAGTANMYTFTFRITNPILQNGKIYIQWPSSVTYSQSSADDYTTVTIYGTLQTAGTYSTTVSSGSRTITITGLFDSSDLAVQDADIVVTIDMFKNPQSQITSSSFVLATQDSNGDNIDYRSTGLTVVSDTPGTIDVQSITYTSYTVDSTFNVTIYEESDLNPTSGTLRVYWPSDVSYNSTLYYSLLVGFSSPTCSVSTANGYIQCTTYKSSPHYYTVGRFQNPLGAMTQSWQLKIYDSSSNLIMEQLTGIEVSSTAGSISVSTKSRSSSAVTVGINSNYTLTFTPAHRLLSDSTIKFILPYDQVKYSSGVTS